MTTVVDASSLLLLTADPAQEPRADAARAVVPVLVERWGIRAPSLLAWELLHVLHARWCREGRMSRGEADIAVRGLLSFVQLVAPGPEHCHAVGALVHEHGLSGYDAAYLACAQELDVDLFVSEDRALTRVAAEVLGSERVRTMDEAFRADLVGEL